MITICIPTLNRYDLLVKLIESAENGGVTPDKYLIIDNGNRIDFTHPKLEIYKPGKNIGVAASWNWLIRNSQEIRIICNDDIEFHYDTLRIILENYGERYIIYPAFVDRSNIYSFFTISDYIFNLVGEFDEKLSPNYGYFEDNDYDFRVKEIIEREGKIVIDYLGVPCGYNHLGSATLKNMSDQQTREHHRKFNIARENFKRKWGRLP